MTECPKCHRIVDELSISEPGGACSKCLSFCSSPPACSEHWHVEVSANGATVLAIGHNFLSGADDIERHTETIRTAANHLLGFIGDAQNKAILKQEH